MNIADILVCVRCVREWGKEGGGLGGGVQVLDVGEQGG